MTQTLTIDKETKKAPIEYPTTYEAPKGAKIIRHFITGGAGFIGSHLIDRLLSQGNKVTVYDNLFSGNKNNIKQHLNNRNFTFIFGELMSSFTLERTIRDHDIVWHLGANTDIRNGNKNTFMDINNCTIATHNVLEAMRDNDIKTLVFASSATVYGDAPETILSEAYAPLLPISLYGAAKLGCEGLVSAYSHLFGIKSVMFRFANVVGSRMNHGVIYDFIQKLKVNPKELEILGDGKQKKGYFLVEECIDGMLHLLNNSLSQCDIFNLGTQSSTTATKVAKIVCDVMGLKDVKFKYTGGRQGWIGDAPVVLYNVSKARHYGWSTQYASDKAVRIATERILRV